MYFYEISPTKIIGREFTALTYSFDEKLQIGILVEIPVGNRKLVGVILRQVSQPDFSTKEILRVLFDTPLPPQTLRIHAWLSEFYSTHPSVVWQTILPAGLAKKRRKIAKKSDINSLENNNLQINRNKNRTNIVFTKDQKLAISKLSDMKSGTAILRGITGSGKTEVYKNLTQEILTTGKSVIILVPEIALTAQLVDDFQRDFSNVTLVHSSQTESERALNWQNILTSENPNIIIGPRSALFMPIKNLGLIIIDECHEPTYKQDRSPRYNALRAAAKLAEFSQTKLILGSATPLITDIFAAKKLNRPIIEMNSLAVKNAKKPQMKIVDLAKRENFSSQSRIFSRELLTAINSALSAKKQVLLFHNRRGSANITLCENCGWTATCKRCFLPLTLHGDKFELICHLCNFHEKVPTKCPECGNVNILHKGLGTKKIEDECRKIFPDKNISRFDGDNTRGETIVEKFAELKNGEIDIIIGTQSIAKGMDFPNLAVVGIVQADAGLNLPDFSANERTFQLIAQAAGRVGRHADDSTVIIQAFQPNATAIKFGSTQNYDEFYETEIKKRAHGHFPPFSHLLKLTCQYKTERGAINASAKLAREIRNEFSDKVKILGPAPAFHERAREYYRWQIVVRSSSRTTLNEISKKVPLVGWQTELDAGSLI